MSDETSGVSPIPKRRFSTVLIALVVVIALLLVASVGVVVANAAEGSPDLRISDEHPTAAGGKVVVTGTATNSGAGDAQNVGVQVTLAVGAGLLAPATIPKLAHGASSPFTATVDLAGGSLPDSFQNSWKAQWDMADFESRDENGSFRYGGHTNGTRTGSLHNVGKADAQNVVLTITFAADEKLTNVLATGTQSWPLVAAGASTPYSVTGDLGANAPQTIWWNWAVAWAEPKVTVSDIKTRWVGGTVTLAGTVTNRGPAAASDVVVTRTLLDATGKALGSSSAKLGRIAAGARADYSLTFPLGDSSFADIQKFPIKTAWSEVHYLLLTTRASRQESG